MCQSHTGRLTGLWFLPKPAFGLNTNDDDESLVLLGLLFIEDYNALAFTQNRGTMNVYGINFENALKKVPLED